MERQHFVTTAGAHPGCRRADSSLGLGSQALYRAPGSKWLQVKPPAYWIFHLAPTQSSVPRAPLRNHPPPSPSLRPFPTDVKMYWHPQGTYLAVKVEAWTKTKKSTTTSFQIFCVKDKDVPLEVGARKF